jgi:hypothetical protein
VVGGLRQADQRYRLAAIGWGAPSASGRCTAVLARYSGIVLAVITASVQLTIYMI